MKKIAALLLALILVLATSAMAEGSMVLYYSHASDWSDPIIKGFEEKYDVLHNVENHVLYKFESSKFNFTPSPLPIPEEFSKSKFTLEKIIQFKIKLK